MQWSAWQDEYQCVVWKMSDESFISWVWDEDRIVIKQKTFEIGEDINTIFSEMFSYD